MTHPLGVIILDRDHLKEVFDTRDKDLSLIEATLEDGDFRYTFQADVHSIYHINVIRNQLTRNISALMPEIVDELNAVLGEELDVIVTEGIPLLTLFTVDWTTFVVYEKALKIVARVSQRVFVGFPLCTDLLLLLELTQGRNPGYIQYAADHAVTVNRISQRLSFFPQVLRPFNQFKPSAEYLGFSHDGIWGQGEEKP